MNNKSLATSLEADSLSEPRLNVTKAFTLHGKTTFYPTKFWLFFDVAYVSPFRFCNVMSDQQQQRDIYVTCDIFVTIFRRLNATFLRTQLPPPLVNNFACEARPPVSLCIRPLYITILRAKRAHSNHCAAAPPPVVDSCIGVEPI